MPDSAMRSNARRFDENLCVLYLFMAPMPR